MQYGEVTDVFIPKPFRAFAFVTFGDDQVKCLRVNKQKKNPLSTRLLGLVHTGTAQLQEAYVEKTPINASWFCLFLGGGLNEYFNSRKKSQWVQPLSGILSIDTCDFFQEENTPTQQMSVELIVMSWTIVAPHLWKRTWLLFFLNQCVSNIHFFNIFIFIFDIIYIIIIWSLKWKMVTSVLIHISLSSSGCPVSLWRGPDH